MESKITKSARSGTAKTKGSIGWRQALYRSVWRWHFYAGVIFAPFLIILAFSGGVYLFKPQIEDQLYKDMLTVREVGESPMTIDEIAAKSERAYPGTKVASITVPENTSSSYMLLVSRDGMGTTMYVDPYTGHALGMLDSDKTFSTFFKKLHSQLVVGGTFANRLVELAACWAVILLLTGLYLWWPRTKAQIWGTVLPRLSKPGSRQFWRDLHAVPAFWLSIVLLLIIMGGLPWSGVMGEQIDRFANATNTNAPPYAYSFGEKPESVTVAKDIAEDLPWAVESLPVPTSAAGGFLPLQLSDAAAIAEREGVEKPYTITQPRGDKGVFTVSTAHEKPGRNATLHLDQYSGAVLTDVRFSDYGIMAKLISYGIAFHEGRIFGLTNQLLGLAACLGLMLTAASSYIMWRKRKPTGKLGAPAGTDNRTVKLVLLLIMLLGGIVMPLVGVSILTVIVIDMLVIRRIKPLRHWFSV
ncbi:PepSY domain-containing protein [Paenibacillus sp. J5C_2022]|uniref:PepSY-associated TM helix domain-containing protein n=1 Tax=Paenibacillus sp. J5C2022 TaxID=2977129 RepID=UPI0021D1B3EF|nr:PepSY domain-containing protein [Paenibacillus sp. J5C2022]MCU6712506.1 PepSY domain-containing protein [Paenibacillus sp. J5C2022]